jgi:hypothetical protein
MEGVEKYAVWRRMSCQKTISDHLHPAMISTLLVGSAELAGEEGISLPRWLPKVYQKFQ